jgi:HSP20 family protein
MLVRFDYPGTLEGLLDEFFAPEVQTPFRVYPAVDVAEHENEWTVVAELPGVKKEDLKITFENGVLTISGERKPYEIPQDARIWLNEMRVRQFSRSVSLGAEVDAERISAELQNGMLKVVVPKAEYARPRTIEVK